jgi:hypothetical protein
MIRSDINTQIDLAINRAITYYSRKERFWFNETTATFNTVANQFNYTSSDTGISNMLYRDLVKITINSTTIIELVERTYKDVQIRNVGNVAGTPEDYAYYKQNWYIYPIPNAVYTITVSYVKSYAALSADGDSNDFTDNAEDLIEARALWWLYSRLLRNKEKADEAKADELEALTALQDQTNRLIRTGKVTPTDF